MPGSTTDASEALFETVGQSGAVDSPEAAETAVEATMTTLGERLTGEQAGDLATYLPRELREPLYGVAEEAAGFGPDAFCERVASGLDGSPADAETATRVVVDAIPDTAAVREFEHVRSQLPRDCDALFDG